MKTLRVFLFIVLADCHAESKHAPPPPAPLPVNADGTYRVVGLDKLARKPIAVLVDASAWSGSPENLPAVTVYEDGAVITCRRNASDQAEIVEGAVRDPVGLAKTIADELDGIAPRVTISGATDQPEVTVYARRGDVWRSVNVVGFRANGTVAARKAETPEGFVAAHSALTKLPLDGVHAFARTDFVVTLRDDSVPSGEAAVWPADVPPPPANLHPDDRWVGRPRSYDLHGNAGTSLKSLASKMQGSGVRTPSGERVSLEVVVAIPSSVWIEKLERCTPWQSEPFHDCDKSVPGR